MATIQMNQIRVHKSRHANVAKTELLEEDKARLQAIDDAKINGFRKTIQIPQLQVSWIQLQPIFSHEVSRSFVQTPIQSKEIQIDQSDDEYLQNLIQTDRPRKRPYNIHKNKEIQHETAQIESNQVVKDTYLSHPNLDVLKFIIVIVWRQVDSRRKGEDFIFNTDNYIMLLAHIIQKKENDTQIVMEEPLMKYNSCTSKKYKKKEIVRLNDVFIKNVSTSNIDSVLWNSIKKLYRVNTDFVKLSDKLELDIGLDDF
ncbi:MAG: hypothetical protein EZS28_034995 [Streblomastix strix]|uniref:Uncharacterized protein n=1 Tax=Streblomastix strix TaxID=222440 RepID=A0A5J4UFP9_9EUKA|nr:MAG: hypothetical protein EZS28_034995 [Streblomastix strix]